jgi:hypothetical protein
MAAVGDVGQRTPRTDLERGRVCWTKGCDELPTVVMVGEDFDVTGVVAAAACDAHKNDALGWFDRPEDVELVDGNAWRQGAGGLWLGALGALAVWWLRR